MRVVRSLLLVFALLLVSVLPTAAQAPTSTTSGQTLYLPTVILGSAGNPSGERFTAGYLNVQSLTDASVDAVTSVCGDRLEEFDPSNPGAAQAATVDAPNDDICLLPGNFPVIQVENNNVIEGYVLGGWSSETKQAWKITSGTMGGSRIETPNSLTIENWDPLDGTIPSFPDGDVVVIRFEQDTSVMAAEFPAVTAAPDGSLVVMQGGGSPLEFLENVLKQIDQFGASSLTVTLSSDQIMEDYEGFPGITPAVCGANEDGVDAFPTPFYGISNLPLTARFGIKFQFIGLTPWGESFHSCMAPDHFISVRTLMTAPEFEGFRQTLRDSGNNSWEQFRQWTILRPNPEVIYAISWVAGSAGVVYTVAKYTAQGVMTGVSSFMIIPEEYIECLLNPYTCHIDPYQ